MGNRKFDRFTFKFGVAKDKDKVESEEAFKEGRRIEAILEARNPINKKAKTTPKASRPSIQTNIKDLLSGMFD